MWVQAPLYPLMDENTKYHWDAIDLLVKLAEETGGWIRTGGRDGEYIEITVPDKWRAPLEDKGIAIRQGTSGHNFARLDGENLISFLFAIRDKYLDWYYKIEDTLDKADIPTGEYAKGGKKRPYDIAERVERALKK